MTTENKTVREMSAAKPDGLTVYHLTKAQGDAAMRKLGHQKADEPFLNGDAGRGLQEKGGLIGKLARHCQKWLTEPDSATTIPLTDAERSQVEKWAGGKLKAAE